MTIDQWITDAATSTPEQVAIAFQQQNLTYAEFAARIRERTAALQTAGIHHGDRVAWYGLNHPEVFILLFACARLGAIFVPLNWRLAENEIAAIVDNCAPSLLFHDQHFKHQASALSSDQTCVICSAFGNDATENATWANATSIAKRSTSTKNSDKTITEEHATQPSIDDALLIVYTSGSTGQPKGAVLTQKALIANARMSVHAFQMTPEDKALVVLPLFHVGGLNILPTPAFSIGATVILHEKFNPDQACNALQQASLAITVPTVLQAIMNSSLWPSANLQTLKALSIGSTDVPVSLIKQVHDRQVPMIQIYGATETGPFAIYQTIDDAFDSVGSIGRKGCACDIRLVSNNEDVALGEPGEIWVKGDNVLREYWRDEPLTQTALRGGWFRTGDVAKKDENGFYWFTDRIKHVIISGGENIYPTEIERVLSQLANITEVSVVGIPHDKWGEIPVAVVVSKSPMSAEEVLTPLHGQLARYKHPKRVVFVETLPRNAMGKIVAEDVKALIKQISNEG